MLSLNDAHLLKTKAFCNGKWMDADAGSSFDVSNPATGEVIASVPDMGIAETRRGIEAANAAWADWRAKTAGERAAILRRWHELLLSHESDLALLITTEQGKPLPEARSEVRYAASFFEWFSEEGKRVYGDVIPSHAPGLRNIVVKQPVGVVAAITPWNFPIGMAAKKIPAALAAGCTFILKPAEDTPLSALALAELGQRAGVPPGVFNVITTQNPKAVGSELTENSTVRKLSFTGSTEVGKQLMRQCADTVKKVSLELGGNAPFIVFDDADLDSAVAGVIASKFRNAGQTCVCANRILVQDSIYDAFAKRLSAATQKLKVGPGVEKGVAVGPLINDEAVAKVERLVGDACDRGAIALTGGKRHELGRTFFQPTVLVNAASDMDLASGEIFGPVAPLFKFTTETEAITQANATQYGLASYFYARDMARIWRVSEALEYGMVGVNTGMISTAVAPFGGVKQSGLGREGSKYGIEEYLETKFICLGGIK